MAAGSQAGPFAQAGQLAFGRHRITTNTWGVHPSTGAAPETGYVDPARTNITISGVSVSNVNFALSQPTAMIHGTIMDPLSNPVPGVQFSARDQPWNQGLSYSVIPIL